MKRYAIAGLTVISVAETAFGNVILNGDFEHGMSGWSAEVHGSASATVVGAISSNALLLAAGSMVSSGDATVSQALPPIAVNDIANLTVRDRLTTNGAKPFVKVIYSDGTSSGSFFGTVDPDPFAWHEENLKPLLMPGKVLQSLEISISDFTVANPVFAYIDSIVMETNAAPQKNLIQNPSFEIYSLYGAPNAQANFVFWTEGPTPSTAIPYANTYASFPMEFGPSNRGSLLNKAYVLGGNIAASYVEQYVKPLGRSDGDIDFGAVNFELSAWLGGFRDQTDDAFIELVFLDALNAKINNKFLGPVTLSDRGGRTRMRFVSVSGVVPPLTRAMTVKVVMRRNAGVVNNGCADDISLVLFSAPARMSGDGSMPGYVGARDAVDITATFLDPITNDVVAETAVSWHADGSFAFAAPVPAGTYDVSLRTPNSLRTIVKNVRVADGGEAKFDFGLILGDLSQDNYVGTDDYLILNSSFDSAESDPEFDSRADLTGDKFVGTDDYLILNNNFDTVGQ